MNISIKASTPYEVIIERGILKKAGKISTQYVKPCNALIITDDKVGPLYLDTLKKTLEENGFSVNTYTFKNGEQSKNIDTFADILNYMAELKMTRGDVIFALGGGVTGDLSGFSAASYLRGIKFIGVPTTFLAAVDSSVGGKTGINLKSGKNLAGAFHQPSLVLCDPDTFNTLPENVFADGVAEALKSGIIADSELFNMFLNGSFLENIERVVSACIKIKGQIVESDEFESGARKLLNLGHTVGHAVEKCSDYSITHGHAVAIGMAIVARAAEKANLLEDGTCKKILNALKMCNLPTSCSFSEDELCEVILNDKKRKGDFVTFVIPERIGKCVLKDISVCDIKNFISLGMEEF